MDGEATAVGRVVGVGQPVTLTKQAACVFQGEADGIRRAMESRNNIGLALHPPCIVGRSSQRSVEERLMRLPEATDVDDDGLIASNGEFAEAEAETPSGVVIEAG